MRHSHSKYFFFLFSFISFVALAQVNTVSPYSRLGVGQLAEQNFTRNLTLGGASTGLFDQLNINLSNPASYSALELTTFESGFKVGFLEQRQETPQDITLNNSSAGLRYFAVAVPFTTYWSGALALKPYSFQGYSISSSSTIVTPPGDELPVESVVQGEGGLTQLVWGNSFTVANGLSLGVNASFLFGKLTENTSTIINGTNSPLDTRTVQNDNVRGLSFEGGALYRLPLKNEREISLGATFSNAANLSSNSTNLTYIYSTAANGREVPVDSLISVQDQKGTLTLPSNFSFGVSYGGSLNVASNRQPWLLSADYHMYNGSEFSNPRGANDNLVNGYGLEFGAMIIPKLAIERLERSNGYFSSVEYRLGGFYESTMYEVRGTQLTNYGITLGLGFPVRPRGVAPGEKKISTINTGVVLGRRGTLKNGLIQENYLNFFIGVTLNDKWFIKYKYR